MFVDSSVVVRKVSIPTFSLGLNDRLNDMTCTVLEETAIPCSVFSFTTGYTPYGNFLDGHDGYWYGFSNSSNSSGDATMKWVKIRKSDLTKTEGTWTLSNAHIKSVGSFKVSTYVERGQRSLIRNGYLYVMSYDDDGLYKINLSNVTDITFVAFGFTSEGRALSGSSTSANSMVLVNDIIIGYDFLVTGNDTAIQIAASYRLPYICTALFQYKEFVTGFGGNYGSDYHTTWLLMPYLASINNLSQAIIKNADKTMKITYTLTEVEEQSS